jgi:hypothetical protein
MPETKDEIEDEFKAYKNVNPDWMTVIVKGQIVAAYQNRLASFSGSHPSIICPTCIYFRLTLPVLFCYHYLLLFNLRIKLTFHSSFL